MVRSRFTLSARLIPVAALLLALVVSLGSVAAAAPTVTANPALVPFDPTPGKPGTTTLTFAANGNTGLTACGQDNGNLPTFKIGAVDPNTPLVVPFPFIQAGTYTFWVSTDSTCAATGGKLATATAARVGPTGKAGQDAVQFRQGAGVAVGFPSSSPTSNITTEEVNILGAGAGGQQKFPIPGVQLCIMSGDGAQVDIATKVGQDIGLPNAANVTVVPFAGQNGCFDVPWIVNGGYAATIARSGATGQYGFCTGAGIGANQPSSPPTATIGVCAQVAFSPGPGNGVPTGTTVNGSIVTGADNHAVEVCVSAFTAVTGRPAIPVLPNTANAYNQSGAVNLTPLTLAFPSRTVAQVTTYDITGPGPGGQGGTQFVCPATTAVQQSATTIAIIPATVPGASIIDIKNYAII